MYRTIPSDLSRDKPVRIVLRNVIPSLALLCHLIFKKYNTIISTKWYKTLKSMGSIQVYRRFWCVVIVNVLSSKKQYLLHTCKYISYPFSITSAFICTRILLELTTQLPKFCILLKLYLSCYWNTSYNTWM